MIWLIFHRALALALDMNCSWCKPMSVVGPGACEIRVRDAGGAFRVIYVAKFADAVYVLHAFQKKTQQTAQVDLSLAKQRYRIALELAKELAKDLAKGAHRD